VALFLPTYIHLFCRLQGEVSTHHPAEIWKTQVRLRIIIAGLCNLGLCPCPQCTIPMAHIPKMEMRRDMLQRVFLACVDDMKQCCCIEGACEAIYEENKGIGSVSVELWKIAWERTLWFQWQWVFLFAIQIMLMFDYFRMLSLTSYHHLTLICLTCWW